MTKDERDEVEDKVSAIISIGQVIQHLPETDCPRHCFAHLGRIVVDLGLKVEDLLGDAPA
jgi:hypothetical protein